MYLIPFFALTDNGLCMLHDSKQDMVVSPVNAGLVKALHQVHGPDSKPILVRRHKSCVMTSITSVNRRCVRSARGKSSGRERLRTAFNAIGP